MDDLKHATGAETINIGKALVIFNTDKERIERWLPLDKLKCNSKLRKNLLYNHKEFIKFL